LGYVDKFNQAPDDQMGVVYKQDDAQFKYSKKKKTDQALSLEKFMARAGPVMEQILDENSKLRSQE
jgi:hypothetical protein